MLLALLPLLLVTQPSLPSRPADAGEPAAPPPDVAPTDDPAPTDTASFRSVVPGQRPLARDESQDATLVSGDRLRESARPSTFEALSQEAGDVYVTSRGGGIHGVGNGATGGIHIRGLGGSPNSQVLMVVDGAPDYQGIFGHPIPDAYPALLLDEALTVKGGDSVLYGTNAMAGAIVLRSRWRTEEGLEVQSDAASGSFGTLKEDLALLGRWGAWDGAGGLSVLRTDGDRDGAGGGTLAGQVGVRWRATPALTLAVHERLLHLTGGDPGPVTHPYTDHTYDVWRQNLALQADYRASAAARVSLVPYLAVGDHRLYDGFASRDTTLGAIAEANLRPARPVELLLGLAGERVEGDVQDRIARKSTPLDTTTAGSAYGQLSLRPMQWLTAVVGGRALYSDPYGFIPLYKAGLRLDGPTGLFLHARVARNFRQPTLRELYLPFPVANPSLEPEDALNTDLGAGFLSDHLELSCTAYRTQATHLIKYFGTWPSAEVVNIDRVVIPGIEARVALRALGPFGLSVSADWQDVGRYTRQNPEGKLDFTLDAEHGWGPHRVSGSLSGEWVHGLYAADYGRNALPDPFSVDLALRYHYAAAERGLVLEPYLFLRNLLDRRYAYVQDYPMPGFSLLAGLKVRI